MKFLPLVLKGGGVASLVYAVGNAVQLGSSALRSKMSKNIFENVTSAPVLAPDLEQIMEMYKAKPSSSFMQDRMSKLVQFEDPITICSGQEEVFEVFRALSILKPKFLNCKSEDSAFYFHMSYVIFGKTVEIKSRLYLEYDKDGKILLIREQWNDVDLFHNFISKAIRRINGYVSCMLTKRLV